jgi:hypothetical protein
LYSFTFFVLQSAHFVIPENIFHGEELFCSHQTCRNGGVKFRFCTVCQVPVAKRNFRQRHMHDMLGSKSKTLCKQAQLKPSSSAAQNQVKQRPLSAVEHSEGATAPAASPEAHSIGIGSFVSPTSPPSPRVAKAETAPNNNTSSQEPHQRGQQQHKVDTPPCEFDKTTDAEMKNTQADLICNSDAGCSSLSSDGDRGTTERDGDEQIKITKNNESVDAQDKKNSSNQSNYSHLEAPALASTKQQVQVNEWLSLLWERPAADDEEGMSLWMERVRGVSHKVLPPPRL